MLLGLPIPAGSPPLLDLVDADVQQRLNLIPADGALVGLVLERARAAVAHAHVAAGQRGGVPACGHADDTLVAVRVVSAVLDR